MGENGGFNNDVNELIKEQKAILKACGIDYKNGNNRYLIISSTSGSYESRTTIRNALKAEWGDHYINMGDVLNSFEAHKFVGYTEEDIAPYAEDIALGKVTPLLLADNCHPNAVGYTVIANTIFERLFDLGLFDELFDYYDSLNA